MSGDLQFLSETSSLLTVRNPIQLFAWAPLLIFAGLTLILGYVQLQVRDQLRGASFLLRNSFPLLWGISVVILFVAAVWSHTLTVSRSASTATLDDRWLGMAYHTRTVPLAQVDSAVTESARGGMRVALVLKGGEALYPFGRAFNTKSSQYRAIQDINGFLGQGGSVGQGSTADSSDDVEQRIQQKIREAEKRSHPQPEQ